MKIRHLLLGVAVVALMTACGGNKNAETTTESTPETVTEQVEATVTEEQPVEEPVAEAPAKKSTSTKATAKETKTTKTETKAEDPCKAKVAAFSAYVAKLEVAKRDKDAGAKQMKAYKELKAQSRDQENSVKDCATGEYKSVVNSLRTKVKTITM
jgi:hypothetical protein